MTVATNVPGFFFPLHRFLISHAIGLLSLIAHTRISVWAFWEYVSFVINSLLFLLIGLELHLGDLSQAWRPAMLALGSVLFGRVLSVYLLVPISNSFSGKIPLRWQHMLVAVWMRGA
jgi:Na+:H+ antiporter